MTRHQITVDGHVYHFELHSYPTGDRVAVHAPGVVPFDVSSLNEARDALRGLYSKSCPPVTGRHRKPYRLHAHLALTARHYRRVLTRPRPGVRALVVYGLALVVTL